MMKSSIKSLGSAKKLLAALLLALIPALASAASGTEALADSAYTAGDYPTALRLYHQAVNTEGVSPEIYYNMGNAFYRMGNLGRSIICYQRALRLDPSMDDARANLEFVRTKILDKPEDDSSFLSNLHASISTWMSPNAWAWTAFALFLAVLCCVALYLFTGNVALRKTGFFGGFILLALTAYAVVIASGVARASASHDTAVVTVPTANMCTSPGGTGADGKIIPVHEGTTVEIVDSTVIPGAVNAPLWYDVKINNSTRAWINAADVERI